MPNHYAVHSLNKSIPKLFKPSVFQELSILKVLTLRSLSLEGNTRKMYIKKKRKLTPANSSKAQNSRLPCATSFEY